MNIAVIGAGGNIARRHAYGYLRIPENAKIAVVVDMNKAAAKRRKAMWAAESWTLDYADALRQEDVEAVDICLPHHLHADVAIAALEAGKHVLVEKPMATTLRDADRIIRAAEKSGLTFMVAESARFVPAHQHVKELLDRKALGRISLARTLQGGPGCLKKMLDPKSWKGTADRGGGGALIDSGVHRLDLYRWFLGEVDYVYAWMEQQEKKLKKKCEDNAVVLLKFKNGAVGELITSWTIRNPWNEILEIYGNKGTALVDILSSQPLAIFSPKFRKEGWFYPSIEHSGGWPGWLLDSIAREVEHFVDCIRRDKEPLVKGEDGRAALEIALAAYSSAQTGRPERLPLR